MANIPKLKRSDLIYPKLCYKIIGILYDVYNNIGAGHKEKYYQKAIAIAFKKEEIGYREQVYIVLRYKGEIVGKYFLDFLIENKIILEIKKGSIYRKKDIDQIYSYLKAKNLKLGILVNFTRSGVKFKRIVNLI